MKDLLKIAVALFLYSGLAPLLGIWLTGRRAWQRVIFVTMIVLTGLRPGNFTFMINSVERYRGHTKGFEISLIEVLALALIVAITRQLRSEHPAQGRRVVRVPGLFLYLLWCSMALVSFVGSPEPGYAWMAASRFFKGALIFAAAALYLRDETDLRWAVGGFAAAIGHQGLLTLKMRVIDGMFQVKGWFEHQNPMAMWCYLGALPVFAMVLHPKVKGKYLWLCLAGYGGAALAILVSVSRASLAAFAVGSACLLGLALLRGFNRRLLGISGMAMIAAVVVFFFGLDSFKARLAEVEQSSQEVELDLRDVLNLQSAAMLRDHPVFGVGWNNFGIVNSRPRGDRYSEILEEWDRDRGFTIYDENYQANPLTESLYWLWLAETGWAGFLTFVLFIVISLTWPLRAMFRLRGTVAGAIAGAIFIALLLCYLHGTVERILTQTKNLSQWMILVGLGAGLLRYSRLFAENKSQRRPAAR